MNFDRDETELNTLYNQYVNLKRDEYWFTEERKLIEIRLSNAEAKLFFFYIDRYNDNLSYDELDKQLDLEFERLNPHLGTIGNLEVSLLREKD